LSPFFSFFLFSFLEIFDNPLGDSLGMGSQNSKTHNNLTIFEILAHPLRCRILEELHNRGEASYSYFTEKMKIPSGTLYHHLKQMKDLIEQGTNKKYLLTSKGAEAIELIHSSESTHFSEQKLAQIPAFNFFASIFRSFSDHPTRSFLEVVSVLLVFFWVISRIGAVVVGSFLLASSELKSHEVILVGFGSWILCAATLELLTRSVYNRQENTLALATASFFMFVLPGLLGGLIFLLNRLEFLESVSSLTLLLVEIGAQIWSIFILISAVSQLKHLSWERATIPALVANNLLLASVLILMSLNIIG